MKKYLASLLPFLFCMIVSFIYRTKTPKEFPDPSYPYQTKQALVSLSITWFYIGIIISATFVSMFIISDLFDYAVKAIGKKRSKTLSKWN